MKHFLSFALCAIIMMGMAFGQKANAQVITSISIMSPVEGDKEEMETLLLESEIPKQVLNVLASEHQPKNGWDVHREEKKVIVLLYAEENTRNSFFTLVVKGEKLEVYFSKLLFMSDIQEILDRHG